MWQIASLTLLLYPLISEATSSNDRYLKHHKSLTSKHPFDLIGDDYDILNEEDLIINECATEPEPFSSKAIYFSYWQCFEAKNVSILCDHGGIQDPKEGIQAFIVLEVSQKKSNHEYIARRPWALKSCKNFVKGFRRLTKDTKHVCISGSLINNQEIDKNGRTNTSWVFDKYKTKNGCDSYFEGECSLKYQIKNGCETATRTR